MSTHKLSIMAVATILTICADAQVHAETADTSAAIAAQSRAFIDGMERGDARAVAGLFTADAKVIVPGVDGAQAVASAAATAAATAAADRVGFPRDYRSALKLLSVAVKDDEPSVMVAYGNELATSVKHASQLPYPYGTVIAMEFAHGVRDGEGQLMYDAGGMAHTGDVARIDVMRRERGYGEAYGESRAGEWEFASYRPDGSTLIAPEDAAACAACHRNAGPGRDFVYRLRVPAE